MLSVNDLCFSYNDAEILHDISFGCERNSVISILGPNGVGKTTLLRCLCAVHKPTSGSITLEGREIFSMSNRELARHIGFVPQSSPPTGNTVFDAALIGRRPYMEWGTSKEDIEITRDVLESLGLLGMSMKRTDRISGGEYQKVQIARAMVQQPDILILDEPTNNLDIANQHMTMRSIMDAVKDRSMCTIMTMHDINLAAFYSDTFIFMKAGRIEAVGGPEIITPELIKSVYGMDVDVIDHKGVLTIVPIRP